MELAEHGTYTIKIEDNILLVDAQGPFNEVILARYQRDMKAVCQQLNGQLWASLVTYYGGGVFTPEAEEGIIEITKYRIKHGMVANASVIINSNHADLQQMQLHRIYQAADITFHVFSEVDQAKSWLKDYIEKQQSQNNSMRKSV